MACLGSPSWTDLDPTHPHRLVPSYIQYVAITARCVRNSLKEEFKIVALRRQESVAKAAVWTEGRMGENVSLLEARPRRTRGSCLTPLALSHQLDTKEILEPRRRGIRTLKEGKRKEGGGYCWTWTGFGRTRKGATLLFFLENLERQQASKPLFYYSYGHIESDALKLFLVEDWGRVNSC